jgi:hypothetical protein
VLNVPPVEMSAGVTGPVTTSLPDSMLTFDVSVPAPGPNAVVDDPTGSFVAT